MGAAIFTSLRPHLIQGTLESTLIDRSNLDKTKSLCTSSCNPQQLDGSCKPSGDRVYADIGEGARLMRLWQLYRAAGAR